METKPFFQSQNAPGKKEAYDWKNENSAACQEFQLLHRKNTTDETKITATYNF